ncbi:MAG: hypothetical protein U0R64_10205 [Candidatus Nanopelagicales bacterium]
MVRRSVFLAAGISGVALVAAGCSSSSTPAETVTVTASPTESAMPTPDETTTTKASSESSLPSAPSGSTKLAVKVNGDAEYARYKTSSMTPKEVVSSYQKQAENDGYTVKNSGGSGGGWGGYGGSEAGMTAEKSGSYLDVQAGGESSGPTYFEVCVGPDSSVRDHCENSSNEDSRSSGS